MSASMICDTAKQVSEKFRSRFQAQDRTQQIMTVAFFCAALFFSIVPFETAQLAFALFGAVTYAGLQSVYARRPRSKARAQNQKNNNITSAAPLRSTSKVREPRTVRGFDASKRDTPKERSRRMTPVAETAPPKLEVRKPSSQPISAPVFNGRGWECEVQELVEQISPTPEGDRIVAQIADFVKQKIRPIIPEVEVAGFTTGDLARGTAFGVAVPDVDIVVSARNDILAMRLQARFAKGNVAPRLDNNKLDIKKLQKSAIRACTDRLVSSGTIKFRRSAFRGEEPKVTLLVPASFGVFKEAIPVDFTVNGCTPLYSAALLAECGKKDPRAQSLILLVRRWAKDRGVCHAAKGHLSPYPWSLLVIYFLQAMDADRPLLPPVEDFEAYLNLVAKSGGKPMPSATSKTAEGSAPQWSPPSDISQEKPVGELFKEFFNFYTKSFDWRNESVSVRTGKRGPPGLSLPLHIIIHEDGSKSEVGPTIEDPFNPGRNLGTCMNAMSMKRLREELARAAEICSSGGSLTQLLQPWAPPENSTGDDDEGAEDGQDGETVKEL